MDVGGGAAVVGHLPGLLRILRGRERAAGEHAAPRRHAETVVGRRVGQRARVDRVGAALSELRDRAAAIGTLVAAIAPARADSPAPARARAVLASLTTRETGARWLREAGAPRVGFRATAALRATLAHTEDDAWRV